MYSNVMKLVQFAIFTSIKPFFIFKAVIFSIKILYVIIIKASNLIRPMEIFKNGNIVTLHLKDFQTFSNQKFTFGPSLNLIAAPNGSGKSSVANAIAFLFNGTPKTIGKSKQIAEYIRFGCKEAEINAEVFSDGKLIRFTRKIGLNHSYFFIDNKLTAQREYYKFLTKMQINVNNLCTFLAQERVGEFCRMDGHELLMEVLNSRRLKDENGVDLLNMDKLKDLYTNIEQVSAALSSTEKQKILMQDTMKILESNMKELEERENNELYLKKLQYFELYLEYNKHKQQYSSLKNELKLTKQKTEENDEKIKVVENKIELLENDSLFSEYKMNVDILLNQNKDLIELESKIKECNLALEMKKFDKETLIKKQAQKLDELNEKKERLKSITQEKLQSIEKFNEEVEKYKLKVDRLYQNDDFVEFLDNSNFINYNFDEKIKIIKPNDLNKSKITEDFKKIEMLRPSTLKLNNKINDVKTTMSQIQLVSERIQKNIEDLEHQKIAFSEQGQVRMEMLKKYHFDTYKGVQWLRTNKNIFKEEILEPSYLHINIQKDFSEYIETFLSFQSLSSFVVKNDEDFSKLTKILKDEMKLNVNVAMLSYSRNEGMSRRDIEYFGLDGVVSDFIECRPEYIDFFNAYGYFNSIPICKGSKNHENHSNINSLEMEIFKRCPNVKRTAICGRYSEIKRSKYDESYIIITNRIFSKGLFTFPKIDIIYINSELFRLNKERELNRKKMEKLLEEKHKFDAKLTILKQEYEISHLSRLLFSLQRQIDNCIYLESEIVERSKTNYDIEMQIIESDIQKRVILIESFIKSMESLLELENIPKFNLKKIKDVKLDIENFKRELAVLQHNNMVEKDHLERLLQSKNNIRASVEKLKASMSTYPKFDIFDNVPKNVTDLENEIKTIKAKLALSTKQDHIKSDYMEKENQLGSIYANINDLSIGLVEFQRQFEEEKNRLILELRRFIEPIDCHFRNMFNKFNFEGELSIDTSKKDWELKIMVKFRKEENLQALSSFRQSGGEKSLSTILFLLALQRCENVPFRLADEINQGMDPHNEKKVFDILREMSDNSQIFIITPKLIEGLEFSETTKAIIIYGGLGITKDIENYVNSTLQ